MTNWEITALGDIFTGKKAPREKEVRKPGRQTDLRMDDLA